MREPVALGFYPDSADRLIRDIEGYIKSSKVSLNNGIVGAVVPHAGYQFSGPVAAYVYGSLPKDAFDLVIVLGTNHTGLGERVSVSDEDWETPLGVVRTDMDVAGDIVDSFESANFDELSHMYEHSIEVQLPFLQKVLGNFSFVGISLSSDLSVATIRRLGSMLAEIASAGRVLIIASSDFTHFGEVYDFVPAKTKKLDWVVDTDNQMIKNILDYDVEGFLELAGQSTVCGYVPIAVLMSAMKSLGAKGGLLKYSTSYDVSRSTDAIVGYGAIAFSKD